MSKRLVIDLLKYVLAIALLVYVVWAQWGTPGSNGLGDVWQRHVVEGMPVHYGFLLAAFALTTGGLLLTLLRWYFLVRAQDLPFTVPDALRIGLIGYFFNICLPGSVGGDIIKAAFLAREHSRRTVAVATVIMDRVIALWALVCFVAISGSVFWLAGYLQGEVAGTSKLVVELAALIVIISALVWIAMGFLPEHRAVIFAGRLERIPRIGVSAAEFWRAVWMYRCRQGTVYLVMCLSWIGQVGFVTSFYCAANVLWDSSDAKAVPGLVEHFLLVPIGLVIRAVIPLPGGIGIGEFGFGKLYQWFGGSAASGVLASLVQRVVELVLAFCGLVVYLRLRVRPTVHNPTSAAEFHSLPVPAAVGEG